MSHSRFLYFFASKRNRISFASFSLRFAKLTKLFFRFVSLNFSASNFSLRYASFRFIFKFSLVLTVYEYNEQGICCNTVQSQLFHPSCSISAVQSQLFNLSCSTRLFHPAVPSQLFTVAVQSTCSILVLAVQSKRFTAAVQ